MAGRGIRARPPDSKKIRCRDTDLKVWVLDVGSGKAELVGNDPWIVPQRTLAPVWSPDSDWEASASRLTSLYRAVCVTNVDTGETKQVTDNGVAMRCAGLGERDRALGCPDAARLPSTRVVQRSRGCAR